MINIFEPVITKESLDKLKDVFDSRWLGRGNFVKEFEDELSLFMKIPHEEITTMSCCSDAIFGVIRLLAKENVKRKKVLVPSISFPAIGSAVIDNDLELIIVDTEETTGNVCLKSLPLDSYDDVLAIFITHYGGNPVDISKLREIVGNDVYILEDSACALGSVLRDGTAVGSKGDFSCWSFDAMKLLVAGEGGAARFQDPELLNKFKESLYLGLPASQKSGIDQSDKIGNWWSYELNDFGRRSVFTNTNAAIALPQFNSLSDKIERRNWIRHEYIKYMEKNIKLEVAPQSGCMVYSNYFFTVLTDSRDELANYLKKNDVYSTFRYYPLHKIDLFSDHADVLDICGADKFSSRALNIPIHNALTDSNVSKIGELLSKF